MRVNRMLTFAGVEYKPGDEIDVTGLDADDRADLISRNTVEAPKAKETAKKEGVK